MVWWPYKLSPVGRIRGWKWTNGSSGCVPWRLLLSDQLLRSAGKLRPLHCLWPRECENSSGTWSIGSDLWHLFWYQTLYLQVTVPAEGTSASLEPSWHCPRKLCAVPGSHIPFPTFPNSFNTPVLSSKPTNTSQCHLYRVTILASHRFGWLGHLKLF